MGLSLSLVGLSFRVFQNSCTWVLFLWYFGVFGPSRDYFFYEHVETFKKQVGENFLFLNSPKIWYILLGQIHIKKHQATFMTGNVVEQLATDNFWHLMILHERPFGAKNLPTSRIIFKKVEHSQKHTLHKIKENRKEKTDYIDQFRQLKELKFKQQYNLLKQKIP